MDKKLAGSQEELIEYISNFIIAKDNISTIVFEATLKEILKLIDEYIDNEVDYFNKIIDSDEGIYTINKLTSKYGDIVIVVKPIGEFIENETIIIEKFSLEDVDMEIESDKIIEIGLEKNQGSEDECNCCECRECDCKCNSDNDEDLGEEESIDILLDEYVEKILQTQGCPDCVREILEELYWQGYNEGVTEELLLQQDILNDRLFGEHGLLN